jgi:hypothetical protein
MSFIRKFFWGVAFSATMMIISSQLNVPAQLMGKLQEMRDIKAKVEEYKQLQSNPGKQGEPRTTLELEAQQNMAKTLQDFVKGEGQTADNTVSDSDMEYIVDGKKMVLINGQYFEARPDNIYMVNGERIFYVNDRRRSKSAKQQKLPEGSVEVSSNSGAPPPGFTANPAQMMLELKKVQQQSKDRDQLLNELMKEEPGAEPEPPPQPKR